MGKIKELMNSISEAPDSPSGRLIKKIDDYVKSKKLAGPKYSNVTGAFNVLSLYFRKEKKMKDPDKRLEFVRNSNDKDLPSFDEIKKFMIANKKNLGLK